MTYDPSTPFKLEEGGNEHVNLNNRINAIDRIKFLSGVDLRLRTKKYRYTLDNTMYNKWYKNESPTKRIDEEWCQRAAGVIKEMERNEISDNDKYVAECNKKPDGLFKKLFKRIMECFYGKSRKTTEIDAT